MTFTYFFFRLGTINSPYWIDKFTYSQFWEESWRMYSIMLPADSSSMGIWNIEIEYEGEIYESIEDIWPDYPSKDDFFFNEDEY